jgi:spermidine/putrescine transport system ATP-binding protein
MPQGAPGTVDLRHVTKRFGDLTAVRDLSLAIEAGEFLALLGGSGCGKTTTLRMLAGFESPDSGSIHIGGLDVARLPPHRRDVNTVFQHYALFPHMNVADNVGYGLRQRGLPRTEIARRVGEALELVQMSGCGARRPRQLSGGQQQRVALARAIVNRPAVLLLDEPLGALDRKLRQQMQVELKLLQSQLAMTFIYVTHDQEEALSMADRIAVMHRGRIEQVGTPDEVYDLPASAFVAGFVGLQNFFEGRLVAPGVVEAGGLTLEGQRSVGVLTLGGRATAAVRPEFVRLSADAPDRRVNAVPGVLASVQPLGDLVQFVVRPEHGAEILVRQPRPDRDRLRPGQRVWCTWDAALVHLFARADDRAEEPLPRVPSEVVAPAGAEPVPVR